MSVAPSPSPRAASPAPGPRSWPMIGNLPEVRRSGLLGFLLENWRTHGDIFSVNLQGPNVVVAHPDAIKHVLLTNASNYIKGRAYDGLRRVTGDGVLALEGAAWKARRSILQPAFHRSSIARLTEIMAESGAAYFDGLLARQGGAAAPIDAHREMVQLTLEVVVAALFGRDLGGATDVSYEALGRAMELISEGGNGVVLPAWVPTPYNRKFHRTMAEVEGAVYRVIEAGRSRGASDGTLLSMLLNSRDAETGEALSDSDLRDEVFTMFLAGHETTALTLTWMFTLLGGRPDVVAAMRAEVDTVLGDRDPGFEDVPKLVYLRQVIDETLRLRGPVGVVARDVVKDDVIAGVTVPAGARIMPFFYATHRHPAFWQDPDTFDPGRFSKERSQGRNPWSYVPFSAGQRQCIGNVFSLVETTVLLAQLFRRFDLEIGEDVGEVKPLLLGTLRPDRPVKIVLRPRAR